MKKILIAEDETATYRAILQCLDRELYEPIRARDPYEAITLASEHRPSLVLMDIEFKNLSSRNDIPYPKLINGIGSAVQIYSRFDIPVSFVTVHTPSVFIHGTALGSACRLSFEDTKIADFIKATFGFVEKEHLFHGSPTLGLRIKRTIEIYTSLSTSTGIIALDSSLVFTALNRRAEDIFGYTLSEINSANVWDVDTRNDLRQLLRDGFRGTREVCVIRKGESPMVLAVNVEPISFAFGPIEVGMRCIIPAAC